MREVSEQDEGTRDAIGAVPAGFAMRAPKTVPRVDYERIFVLDAKTNLIGEYALNDECPLEGHDLKRSVPVSGLRHLVMFYQGEYAFTPFKVDDLWFVVLTRGVPRIEERGSVGTLLAAARIHIPPMVEPLVSKREADVRLQEAELAQREADLLRREQHVAGMDAELRVASTQLSDLERDVRAREAKLVTLRDYAVQLQRTFVPAKAEKPKDGGVSSGPSAPQP